MGRNGRSSPAVHSLPKVVYEKIEDDVSTQPGGVHDLQARSYGCKCLKLSHRALIDGGVDNDFSDFVRPEHYIRHLGMFSVFCHFTESHSQLLEHLECDLARQVEYDMDEQGQFIMWSISVHYTNDLNDVDQEWLDAINAERRKEQLDKVSYELFEIVMDRLEKEWFDLVGHRRVSSGYL